MKRLRRPPADAASITRDITYPARQPDGSLAPTHYTATITVDLHTLLREYVTKAIRSPKHTATSNYGAIIVTATPVTK